MQYGKIYNNFFNYIKNKFLIKSNITLKIKKEEVSTDNNKNKNSISKKGTNKKDFIEIKTLLWENNNNTTDKKYLKLLTLRLTSILLFFCISQNE